MVAGGRPRTLPPALVVWANGLRVGTWSVRAGTHQLQYDDAWLRSPAGRPLSLSLPFTPGNVPHRGDAVRHWFDNLLPDNDTIRRRLQERFATRTADAFALLSAIGRDCAGMVQLLPEGMDAHGHDHVEAAPLTESGVAQALRDAAAGGRVLGQEAPDGFRISIAGAQEKTALLHHGGRWCRPQGATPTTHIFKLPLGLIGNVQADMRDSVPNEWLCAQLLLLMGLPVAQTQMARFEDMQALVVTRFDRAWLHPDSGTPWIARLPQEDLCQALGVPGTQRYESDGGPGVAAILRRLDTSKQPVQDKRMFLKAQFMFWLLAATDGHAKNFSIFLERDGFRLTPLYDVLSIWPIVGSGRGQIHRRNARLAMAVRSTNAHYRLQEVQTRHWQALAQGSGVPDLFDQFVAMALQVPLVVEQAREMLPRGFPRSVIDAIDEGLRAQAARFVDGLG